MDTDLMWIAVASVGVLVGWLIAFLVFSGKKKSVLIEAESLKNELDGANSEGAAMRERCQSLENQLSENKKSLSEERENNVSLKTRYAVSEERNRSLENSLAQQKEEMVELQKKLATDFENLANRIFEEKSKSFTERNKESLDKLLGPLGENISSFRERVEKAREADIKDRASLSEHLKSLKELNMQMSQDAQDLTTALKGESKTRGIWGELVLERVLEKSGLSAGREYDLQVSLKTEEGKRFQPDAIVNLPDEKHIVIDAKVSLVAYERYSKSDDVDERAIQSKAHLESVKRHISDLGTKQYGSLSGIQSPDFTLMFIPVEPAFSTAIAADDGLYDFAYGKNVILVTPSTLLATLRIVANIWRQEKQANNALEIAKKSGDLYDKFVGFCEDLEEVGHRLEKSQEAYESAVSKLSSGKGNLIRRVEQLKALGARAKKSMPASMSKELELE
ncbi:DNA recombination protein RmuC [Puniceicoccaceae bacterium K14]|nr:DNA recombination protein RmuC [Puniceicoccaceae bacterium K14]